MLMSPMQRICGQIGVIVQACASRMRVTSTSDLHAGPGDPRLGLLRTQHHHSGRCPNLGGPLIPGGQVEQGLS